MSFFLRLASCILVAAPLAFAEAAASVDGESAKPAEKQVSQVVSTSQIGGEISGFLSQTNSPYQVERTLIVPEGKALVVEAGVVLNFASEAGLDVQGGSLAVVGENGSPVVFQAADKGSHWNGISITGQRPASFQYTEIRDAEVAMAVEKGVAELKDVNIENSRDIGFYAKSASVDIQWSSFKNNKGVSLWADAGAFVNIDAVVFYNNNIAFVAGENSNISLQLTKIAHNEVGVVDMERNRFRQLRSQVTQNKVGFVATDMPSDEMKGAIQGNITNFSQVVAPIVATMPSEPSNAYAENFRAVSQWLNPGVADSSWHVSGSVGLKAGYHQVWTRHNHSGEDYVMDSDTVADGELYENYFQVPGFFSELNTHLMMESVTGQTIELSADLSTDKWKRLNVQNLLAVYSDKIQRLALGDVYLSAGSAYLAGVNVFGASYDLNLFQNRAGEPLFVVSAFGGESQKPKIVGERNEEIYKDYIDDGEGVPQELLAGGKVRWNMHRRFNGTLGFIGSKDYLEDPLLRDGMSDRVNTASPIVSSKTFFADGNWLFFPGDIELNGQVALGAADTANATLQRAINNVFVDAGLDASNFSKLRKLMNNPRTEVMRMKTEQLEEFFGDNSMKTEGEMQEELIRLLELAKDVYEKSKDEEESPSDVKSWDGQNYSVAASLRWEIGKVLIQGHLGFVGSSFYSAGSPDLVQNSRQFGGSIEQKLMDFWKLTMGYELVVENASHGNKYNVFGLSEGSEWGVFLGADEDWLEEHDQDENRTLYDHTASISNVFDISQKLQLTVGYSVNLRNRWTNQRLYADYSLSSGVYEDSWFAAREKNVLKIPNGNDTLYLDSLRWADYYELAGEEYLATQFNERIAKHTINLEMKFNLPKNVLKVGGIWTFREDLSRFVQDELIQDLNLSDETFGILGYYFHGADYFEQRYPVSLMTNFSRIRNMISVTPRYKLYNRDDMKDFEWKLIESLNVALSKNFIDLSLTGGIRQEFLSRKEMGKKITTDESDYEGAMTLKFFHTDNFTTEWTVGTFLNYRPDLRSDEYKDLYGIVNLNYVF